LIYIDNLAAAVSEALQLNWFYTKLSERFNTKDLKNISKILGIRVIKNCTRKTFELDQKQYIDKFLRKFRFSNNIYKSISLSINSYKDLCSDIASDIYINATWYRKIIGSVIYIIVYIKPNIAFILEKLSQYIQNPCKHYKCAVQRLLRYLKSFILIKISFEPKKNLIVYFNIDYITNKIDRKSIIASIGLLGGELVF